MYTRRKARELASPAGASRTELPRRDDAHWFGRHGERHEACNRHGAAVTEVRPEIWDRLVELGKLKPGWLDGEGLSPGPGVIAYAARIAESFTGLFGPLRIYPTPEGGIELEWDDANLNHTVIVGPDLRLNLTTIDREDKT
jgi:hypothetical protein